MRPIPAGAFQGKGEGGHDPASAPQRGRKRKWPYRAPCSLCGEQSRAGERGGKGKGTGVVSAVDSAGRKRKEGGRKVNRGKFSTSRASSP